MNVAEELDLAHILVLQAVDDLPEAMWDMPGVCGDWSVKETVAHLVAYELLLLDILRSVQERQGPTPYMLRYAQSQEIFNAETVETRKYQTAQQVLNDYQEAQVQTTSLLAQVAPEDLQRDDLVTWYKREITPATLIERLIGHAQKHCEQIMAFREQNKSLE